MSNQPQLTFAGMVPAEAAERCELHDDDCETCDSTCPSYCGAPAKYALVTRLDGREVRTAFCEGHLGAMAALSEGMRRTQTSEAN